MADPSAELAPVTPQSAVVGEQKDSQVALDDAANAGDAAEVANAGARGVGDVGGDPGIGYPTPYTPYPIPHSDGGGDLVSGTLAPHAASLQPSSGEHAQASSVGGGHGGTESLMDSHTRLAPFLYTVLEPYLTPSASGATCPCNIRCTLSMRHVGLAALEWPFEAPFRVKSFQE